jgi:serine/threonine-protein kinase
MVADVVLEVLDVAHRSGVVHRDIKPDNLFITRGGAGRERVKVLDFGLARLLEGQPLTVHGVAIGTPPYMSPEQAAGRADEIDGRTDLFALAASGFRLITGRRIHEAGASVELVKTMGKLAAPRIRTVAPEVSEAFARVVDRALEFRREDRYESAAAMRADVESALAVEGTGAARTRPLGDARGDASIELSASDLEPIMSVQLHDIESVKSVKSIELSASDVEAVKDSEPSTRVLEAVRPAEPAKAPARVAPTEPMPATVTSTPAEPPAPLPQTPPPRPRSRLLRVGLAAVGLAVVCAGGAFAAGWLEESEPPDASTPSGYAIPPSVTTHLSPSKPAPDERAKTPGKRTRH